MFATTGDDPSGIAGIGLNGQRTGNPRRYFAKPGDAEWGC